MKRKVTLHGHATLSVSLPLAWVKKYGIKKGDEVEVEEKEGQLAITTKKQGTSEKATIDVSGFSKSIHRFLPALYKSGFDIIEFTFSSQEEGLLLEETINNELIGFEIIEQSSKKIIVKKITEMSTEEIRTIINRLFQFISLIAKECLESVRKQQYDQLCHTAEKDRNVNKLANFCRRAINKNMATGFKRQGPLYYVIENAEKIADAHKDIALHFSKQKKPMDNKLIRIYEELNLFYEDAFSMFRSFDLAKYESFLDKRNYLKQSILKEQWQEMNKVIVSEFIKLLEHTFNLNGAIISLAY